MNRLEIHFDVPGIPRPQGSKQGFVNKKTGGVILTESGGQAHKDWRAVVALAAVEAMSDMSPFEGPLAARFTFKLPRPKSHGKRITFPDKRPDLDKLARSCLDALTHIVFKDDGQIITLNLRKRWAQPDNDYPVGVEIVIQQGEPGMTRKIAIPVDWYLGTDGIQRPRTDTRWIEVFLHPDGSVTWGPPVTIPGGVITK